MVSLSRLSFASLALAFAALALSSGQAQACTCGTPLQGAAALVDGNGIVTIFEGRLDRVVDIAPRVWSEVVPPAAPAPTVRFDYTVIRWWKADPGARVSVLAPKSMYAGCSRSLPGPAGNYLVYAASQPSVAPLVDGACSATKLLLSAAPPAQELAELGSGESPRGDSLAPPPTEGGGESSGCSIGTATSVGPCFTLVALILIVAFRSSLASSVRNERR